MEPFRMLKMLLAAAASVAVLAAPVQPRAAEQWPTRTVKVIVPFPAGGNTDSQARIVSERAAGRTLTSACQSASATASTAPP